MQQTPCFAVGLTNRSIRMHSDTSRIKIQPPNSTLTPPLSPSHPSRRHMRTLGSAGAQLQECTLQSRQQRWRVGAVGMMGLRPYRPLHNRTPETVQTCLAPLR
jgi:hypothetical protein